MQAYPLLHRRLACSSAKSTPFASYLLHPSQRAQITPPLPLGLSPLALSYLPRRPISTSPLSSSTEPRKASTFWTITFTLLLVCGGTWLQDKYRALGNDPSPPSTVPESPSQDHFLGVIDTLKTMTTEPAPGTVGNLTPEQEAKLQEFWILLFKVCGIHMEGVESETAEAAAAAAAAAEEKKKQPKRRFGLFGRGNEEQDDSANTTSANGAAHSLAALTITDGDDKFGQSKDFQKALSEMKPEEIRATFWNMVKQDNPDGLLLRFLRARKWDVKKALIMFISTIRWRLLEAKVDEDVMKNGEHLALEQSKASNAAEKKLADEFLMQFRLGKSYLHGVDKSGRPICVVRVRLHKPGDQSTDALDRFTVFTIESARMMLAPPVETACIIFDMTNFSLANMDYHPVKFMIKCFEANYPESLGVVLIHKAPWIFSSIWNIIKGWLDPVVAAKIRFTKNLEDLEEIIAKDRIPKELDGDEEWEYKYVEVKPGENDKMADTTKRDALLAERQELAKEVQDITIEWVRSSKNKEEEKAKAAAEKRKELIERLRVQYWQMDPYVRCSNLYDRLNILQGGGKINFYPPEVKEDGESKTETTQSETTTSDDSAIKAE